MHYIIGQKCITPYGIGVVHGESKHGLDVFVPTLGYTSTYAIHNVELIDPRTDSFYKEKIMELLAIIHRDGGHRVNDVGFDLAYREACSQVFEWLSKEED